MTVVGRFAPSPTGRMHAGNIFASLVAWLTAKSQGGEVVLRIEDLDRDRSKPEFIDRIPRDYELLGLNWDRGPFYQSGRDDVYAEYYRELDKQDLLYPCFCSRADLLSASAPHRGEKTVYTGRCRDLDETMQPVVDAVTNLQDTIITTLIAESIRMSANAQHITEV